MSASVTGRPVNGRVEREQPVAHGRLAPHVAAVLRLHPHQGRRLVGAPLGRAGPRRHRVELGRHVVAQRQIGDAVHLAAGQVGDHDLVGKSAAGTL
jgi:hypothetical protein